VGVLELRWEESSVYTKLSVFGYSQLVQRRRGLEPDDSCSKLSSTPTVLHLRFFIRVDSGISIVGDRLTSK
jgi:hypothetical protein